MPEQKKFQKKHIIEEPPQIFPKLTKQIQNLDDLIASRPSINKLGSYAICLNNMKKKSIYKKLLGVNKDKNIDSHQIKEIRNRYLKKLVENNSFFFPKELGLEKYKKPINPKEDKFNRFLNHLEEIAKKEKNLFDNSGKSTVNNMESRKESLLDNKRKRTDSIYEKKNNKKKKKEKGKEKDNEDKEENEEENEGFEENEGEVSYNKESYGIRDEDDSQNYYYSEGDGGNDDYD